MSTHTHRLGKSHRIVSQTYLAISKITKSSLTPEMSDEVAIVDEFEKDRVRLREEQNEAVKEESVLVAQLTAIDVERKATIAHLDAKRKELLRGLKEERQSVLSEIKKRKRKLLGKIQSARNRQQRALDKIEHLRGVKDLHLARLRSSKLKRKVHEDESGGDDDQEDEEEEDEDEIDDNEEAEEDPELEEWKRLSDAFKNHNKDIVIGTDRRKAVCRAFHELEELKVVAPPPYNESNAVQPRSEVKTLEQLLAAIRKDEVSVVYQYGPDLLTTSVVEELAARNDSTHDGVLRLPGVRALIAALTSPDCSWRTLKLLVEWAKASGPHADIYDVREMERYWVAGFKGLTWCDASSSSSSLTGAQELLPQSYVPKNRMDKKIVRDWELDVLVPIIDIDSEADPDSNASSSSEESMLCKVYQAPILDANLRRLVNQASKLFEVCRGGLVSGVYHCVLATDESLEGWDLEERRGRLGRKKVQLNDKESDAARRVVRACWRLE